MNSDTDISTADTVPRWHAHMPLVIRTSRLDEFEAIDADILSDLAPVRTGASAERIIAISDDQVGLVCELTLGSARRLGEALLRTVSECDPTES